MNRQIRNIIYSIVRKYLLIGFLTFFITPLFAQPFINATGKTVESLFVTPSGYVRVPVEEVSYAAYLRNLPLLPHGSLVKYYDGSPKPNNNIYTGVIFIDVGLEDLQQAPEICIRLRGEYLFKQQQYNKISFTISNHKRV